MVAARVPVLKVRVKAPVVRGLSERVARVPLPCLPPSTADDTGDCDV